METRLLGQTLLREPAFQPERPDGMPEGDEDIRRRVDGHLPTLREGMTAHHAL